MTCQIVKVDVSIGDGRKLEAELIEKYGRLDLGTGTLLNRFVVWETNVEPSPKKHEREFSEKRVRKRANPGHPGLLIAESLKTIDVSMAKAAKMLGLSRQALHKIIIGRSALTPALAIRLEKSFGSTAETWLSMQNAYSLVQVRRTAPKIDMRAKLFFRRAEMASRKYVSTSYFR